MSRQFSREFLFDVQRGLVPKHSIINKFGFNSDIDTGAVPEDIWNGGGLYTGFDATAAETLEVYADTGGTVNTGSVLSSGTATSGSATTLTDTGATFSTDGVAVGDLLIDDTQSIHSVITGVTETILTLNHLMDGDEVETVYVVAASDAYRVVTASSTGAAVIRMPNLLDSTYVKSTEYIVLNGTTAVDTVGTYLRCSRAVVVLAGSGGSNDVAIIVRQKTTTANVMMSMPAGKNRTHICADTIPAGYHGYIFSYGGSILRGTSGRGEVDLMVRPYGEVFQSRQPIDISQAGGQGGRNGHPFSTIEPKSDICVRCFDVGANNTGMTAHFDILLIED